MGHSQGIDKYAHTLHVCLSSRPVLEALVFSASLSQHHSFFHHMQFSEESSQVFRLAVVLVALVIAIIFILRVVLQVFHIRPASP
jgi:hypothetical protein